MASSGRWWVRLAATLGATLASVLVPVAAWAATPTGALVVEAARRRRGGGVGFLTLLCCLVVVGIIVAVVYLIQRNRGSRGR